jgi:uncharacterized phage-like protein YoqJ
MGFKLSTPEESKASQDIMEAEHQLRKVTVFHTGPRPKTLGKCYYDTDPLFVEIKYHTMKVQEQLILEGKSRFVCGGANGFDTITFFSALELKKKYPHIHIILAIPSETYHIKWYDQKVLTLYADMLQSADEVVFVDSVEKYKVVTDGMSDLQIATIKNYKRNEFMVDLGYTCFALWDGQDGGTKHCVNKAVKSGRTMYTMRPGNYHLEVIYGNYVQ